MTLTVPVQLTKLGETWWCCYQDHGTIWARGETAEKAEATLRGLVPRPWQPAAEDAEVVTYERDGHGFAGDAADAELRIVATGDGADAAEGNLLLHVPVPQPTGGSTGDKPPKLEKKPLPPV